MAQIKTLSDERVNKLKEIIKKGGQDATKAKKILQKNLLNKERKAATAKASEGKRLGKVKGTEKIDTISRQPVISAMDRIKKVDAIRAAKKAAKKGLKALPLVGGLATALMNRDVSAAIPVLGSADEVGRGSDKPPKMTEERKKQLRKTMEEQAKKPDKKPKTLKSVAKKILGLE